MPPLEEGDVLACRELQPAGAQHAAAGAVHRGESREGARGARHRSSVHVRERDRDVVAPRLRVEEGECAGSVVDRVREAAAVRAPLRAPHRLRLHRDDGRSARRDRARRRRKREVAPLLLLRQRHGRAPRARRRRRTSRRSILRRSTRCRSASTTTAARSSCGFGTTARASNAATTRRRFPSSSFPTSSPLRAPRSSSRKGRAGPRVFGSDPESGLTVLVFSGRYGPFVQLGELDASELGKARKPKRSRSARRCSPT